MVQLLPVAGFVVEYRYRVHAVDQGRYQELLAEFRDYVLDLGLAGFHVWRDEEDPARIVEWHGYDSWSHYQRVAQKDTPPEIERLYDEMDRLIDGGLASVETRQYAPWKLPITAGQRT